MQDSSTQNDISRVMRQPMVSVVIPAYNSSQFIAAAVESIQRQTFSDYEIIVVNDGSPDTPDLETALQPFSSKLHYLRQENRGPSAARNLGIRNARGRYIAFLDSDDVWLPHHLSEQIGHFGKDSRLGLVYANNAQIKNGEYLHDAFDRFPQTGPVTLESLLEYRCVVNTSSVVVVREALLDVGLFDEEMWRCEDFDLWLRLAERGVKMTYDPGVQVVHRLGAGLASDKERMKRARQVVFQKVLARMTLAPHQVELVNVKIRDLEKEIAIEVAKRHLRAGSYDEAFAAVERAKSLEPDMRLRLARSGLRYCPDLLRWCYRHYLELRQSYRYKSRAESRKKGQQIDLA
jgi:glycosyltransferase involved in cell wall biosynthesis